MYPLKSPTSTPKIPSMVSEQKDLLNKYFQQFGGAIGYNFEFL